jgi:hypothetical protein
MFVKFVETEHQSFRFAIQRRVMTRHETKEYHLQKLYLMSLNSIGQIPQLQEPNYEQKQYVLHRLKSPRNFWRRSAK